MKYRKKPIVIEAYRIPLLNQEPSPAPVWLMTALIDGKVKGDYETKLLYIQTLEGEMTGSPGDWIIQGVKGEIYPCKPDIFEATYDAEPTAVDGETKP